MIVKTTLLSFLILLLISSYAEAQQVITLCVQATGSNGGLTCVPVTTSNPIPTRSQ